MSNAKRIRLIAVDQNYITGDEYDKCFQIGSEGTVTFESEVGVWVLMDGYIADPLYFSKVRPEFEFI